MTSPTLLRRLIDGAGWALLLASSLIAAVRFAVAKHPLDRTTISLLALAWVASGQLMAIPYCRRFAGERRARIKIGALLALLYCGPLAPFFWKLAPWDREALYWTVGGVTLLALRVAAILRSQGRYGGTDRDYPELTGDPRAVAEDVLGRAGLAVASIRVAPFKCFNAMVQGFERCIVVVDRRAAETLPSSEFAALIAHEAGHVKHGGIFPRLAVLPILFLGANVFVVLGWSSSWNIVCLGAEFLLLKTALSHWLELRCDRFAARLTGPGVVQQLLEKIHRDLPRESMRLTSTGWLAPFFSHPALEVRTAVLGGVRGGAARVHCAAWTLAFTLVLAIPAGTGIARETLRRDLGRFDVALTVGPFYAYGLAWFALGSLAASLLRKPRRKQALRPKMGKGFVLVTAASWILTLCLLVTLREPTAVLLSFLVSLLLLVAGLFLGAFRYGQPVRRERYRQRVLEGCAALVEGKPEEGLALAEAALRKHPRDVQIGLLKASCLIHLGRTDEAEASLAAPLRDDGVRTSAELILASVEHLRGNLERMFELARKVCEEEPVNATAWILLGNAARKLGRLDESDAACARACDLSENEASALSLRALAALERRPPPAEVDAWLSLARSKDARNPVVLLATARCHQTKGRLDLAHGELLAALEELRRKGMHGWIAVYEREARSWGLPGTGTTPPRSGPTLASS